MRSVNKPPALRLFLAAMLIVAACNDSELSAPGAEKAPNGAREFLVQAGFRRDMIVEMDDHYLVEGDIVISKESIQAALQRASRLLPVDTGTVFAQHHRTDMIVTLSNAEKVVVDLSHLDNNAPEWASAARLAMADWNALTCSATPCTKYSWLRFVEGSPADIHFIADDTINAGTAGKARFPLHAAVVGKPGDTIFVNPNFNPQLNTAGARRFTVVHELGHAVGLRHTNWQAGGEQSDTAGAVFIPGTVTHDPASVMNGGVAGTEFNQFSNNDVIAIETLYPRPSLQVNGPTWISTAGVNEWTRSAGPGPGQSYAWLRENMSTHPSGGGPPFVIDGNTSSVFIDVGEWDCASFGPSFRVWARLTGNAGQVADEFRSVSVFVCSQ